MIKTLSIQLTLETSGAFLKYLWHHQPKIIRFLAGISALIRFQKKLNHSVAHLKLLRHLLHVGTERSTKKSEYKKYISFQNANSTFVGIWAWNII